MPPEITPTETREAERFTHLDEPQPIEIRSMEQREIVGRIVPYGETIQVRGRPESFARGALANVDPATVKLLMHHDQKRPVGRMVALEERSDGAYGVFKVSRTRAGDDALQEAADGLLSFSPGFYTGDQTQGGVHTRVKAMPEVSLVAFPAYAGASVMAVREKEVPVEPTTDTETVETREAVDITILETRMDEMSVALDRLTAVINAPGNIETRAAAPTPLEWFAAQVEAVRGDSFERREALAEKWEKFQTRALDDIVGGETQAGDNSPSADDLSGLVVEEFMASQLVNVLDRRRPMFASLGSFPMPRSGYAKIPTITQHVEVAARAGQKEEANSRTMISKNATFEANWLDGAVDVALEVIAQADLPVMSLVWDDLLGAYAQATEHDPAVGIVPLIEAGGLGFTYTGAALLDGNPTYSEFISAVETQVDTIEDATGLPPNRLAVTRTQWATLVGMVDQDGRRIFSTVNPSNADTSGVTLTARSFSLPGGIEVYKVKNLTQAVLFNTDSLKASDSGPVRVEATNVTLMGRDIGLLGRTMLIPRIPAGVVVFGTDPESSS